MKLALREEGITAMHLAPDMMLSGIARSGADMIWLSTVPAVWMRSKSASRRSDARARLAKHNVTAKTVMVFFIARLQVEKRGAPALTGKFILEPLMKQEEERKRVAGYSLVTSTGGRQKRSNQPATLKLPVTANIKGWKRR